MELTEILNKFDKSKIKAGDGRKDGIYPLYTCSPKVNKFLDNYLYDTEAIILSTGGNPVINYHKGKFSYSSDCLAVQSNGKFENKYIYYYLISKTNEIAKMFRGAGLKHLNKKEFFKMNIELINIEEQKKIIKELDLINKLMNYKRKQIKLFDNFIKSQFVEMFGIPFLNNKNWTMGIIKELVREVKYGTSKPANGGKYKYLRMNNITYEGKLDLNEMKYIDIEKDDKEKYVIKKGDILFNRTNSKELVGKTCVFDVEEEMIIAGFIIRVRVNDFANPYFISEYLNTVYLKDKLRNMCKDASGQSNINAKELQNIKIYIPPITLQNQFSEIVKQIDKQKFESMIQLKMIEKIYNIINDRSRYV